MTYVGEIGWTFGKKIHAMKITENQPLQQFQLDYREILVLRELQRKSRSFKKRKSHGSSAVASNVVSDRGRPTEMVSRTLFATRQEWTVDVDSVIYLLSCFNNGPVDLVRR